MTQLAKQGQLAKCQLFLKASIISTLGVTLNILKNVFINFIYYTFIICNHNSDGKFLSVKTRIIQKPVK